MQEYKHQILINEYQLDVGKFPDSLRKSVISFLELAPGTKEDQEAKLLLPKLDDNISFHILSWIKSHKDNLEDIICEDCSYKQFYQIVKSLVPSSWPAKLNIVGKEIISSDGYRTVYHLTYLKETTFSECSYYSLEAYRLKPNSKKLIGFYVLKVCEFSKTIEPVYVKLEDQDHELLAYDYINHGPEINFEDKRELDKYFKKLLLEMVIDYKFYPDALSGIIQQLKISIN